MLDGLSARHEGRLDGPPWTRDKLDPAKFQKLLAGIVGFELEIRARRPTLKLSQNKPDEERERVAAGMEAAGAAAIAHLVRTLAK